MWQALGVVHRKRDPGTPFREGTEARSWRTCLREIQFLPAGSSPPVQQGGEWYSGLEAHRFLVEICAGLHSPLLGETEVFGQFRSFRESQDWEPAWVPFLNAVEEDAKKLRRSVLKSLGSQSYGSLVRKRLPDGDPVVIVGGGRLVRDLFPWLKERPIHFLARDPFKLANESWLKEKGSYPVSPIHSEANCLIGSRAHWVVAAPVGNEVLAHWWKRSSAGIVLDFRGEEKFEERPEGTEGYFDLHSLFAELEEIRLAQEKKKAEALKRVKELSLAREAEVVHRPYGWEDAFA